MIFPLPSPPNSTGSTPRGSQPSQAAIAGSVTPSHTPLRDQLSINPEEAIAAASGEGFESSREVFQQQVLHLHCVYIQYRSRASLQILARDLQGACECFACAHELFASCMRTACECTHLHAKYFYRTRRTLSLLTKRGSLWGKVFAASLFALTSWYSEILLRQTSDPPASHTATCTVQVCHSKPSSRQ